MNVLYVRVMVMVIGLRRTFAIADLCDAGPEPNVCGAFHRITTTSD